MRKIRIDDYKVPVAKMVNGERVETLEAYEVKKSLCMILFHTNQQISAREAIVRDALCTRIENTIDDYILLEEEDYNRFVKSIDTIPAIGRNDVELVHRIYDAKEVPLSLVEK
jgi:hypothetical protein